MEAVSIWFCRHTVCKHALVFLFALELGCHSVILPGGVFTETHLPLPPSHTMMPLDGTFVFLFFTVWRLIQGAIS